MAEPPRRRSRNKIPPGATPKRPWGNSQGKLSELERRFVDEYMVDGNGGAAMVRAGYGAGGAKQEASKKLKQPKIAAELQRRRAEMQARHNITLDRLTEMTVEAYELAKSGAEPASMVAAVRQLSKMHGFDVDKRDNKRDPLEELDAASRQQLLDAIDTELASRKGEAGVSGEVGQA